MGTIREDTTLRDRTRVFRDRHDAGRRLGAFLLRENLPANPVVLAIPAGGVPVGAEIARALHAPLALAIVRKVQIPGNTEAGFGAMSWDGKVFFNKPLMQRIGLTQRDVDAALEKTRKNITERLEKFTGGRPLPDISGKSVILTDDGLASGYTMLAAIASVRNRGPDRLIVAVPTASASSASLVAARVDELVCLNVRTGPWFAVADAYENWYDLDDREVLAELGEFRKE
jgi:predicted phosphoribosyltransferase